MSEVPGTLVYRFWSLPLSERRKIAKSLALIEAAEFGLPESERDRLILLRAKERGLLDEVMRRVEQWNSQR